MIKFATDSVRIRLQAAKDYADTLGLRSQLDDVLNYLDTYGSGASHRTRCTLFYDTAPHSFYVLMEVRDNAGDSEWRQCWQGGLMFHGPADGFGSGNGPTYSVCVNSIHGWSVHT